MSSFNIMGWLKLHYWEIITIFMWLISLSLGMIYPKPTEPYLKLQLEPENVSNVDEIYSSIKWPEKLIIYEPNPDEEEFKKIKKRAKIIIKNKRIFLAEEVILSIELTPENFKFATIKFDNPDWQNISDENQPEIQGFEREVRNKLRLNIKDISKESRVILIWFLKISEEEANKFNIKVEATYNQGSRVRKIKQEKTIYINNENVF